MAKPGACVGLKNLVARYETNLIYSNSEVCCSYSEAKIFTGNEMKGIVDTTFIGGGRFHGIMVLFVYCSPQCLWQRYGNVIHKLRILNFFLK